MYLHVGVYSTIYVYTYIELYVYLYIHTDLYLYIQVEYDCISIYLYVCVCVYVRVCTHTILCHGREAYISKDILPPEHVMCALFGPCCWVWEVQFLAKKEREKEGEGFHGLREPIRFWTLFLLLGKGSPKVEPQKGLRSWPQGAEAKGWARGCEGWGRSTWGLSCPCHTLDTRRELSLIGRNWSLQLPVSFQLAGLLGRWGPAYTHLSRLCVAEGGGLDRAGQHDHFIYYYFFKWNMKTFWDLLW